MRRFLIRLVGEENREHNTVTKILIRGCKAFLLVRLDTFLRGRDRLPLVSDCN